ncbi:MAG: guanylate kinase [Myxococcales bacterium]|nr:guanylate kinase [Myxococcales bacterium]
MRQAQLWTNDFLPLIVTSPSGAGKTTLVRRLVEALADMTVSVSYTTRLPRGNEVDGRDYHFISEARFAEMLSQDAFAEWAEVHGHRYGTSVAKIEEARETHRGMIFVIDVQGARQIKARIHEAVGVFILPPSLHELERRLRGRGTDSDATIFKRMSNALGEMQHYGAFEYVVINDDLDEAAAELVSIVKAERARRWRRGRAVEGVMQGRDVARAAAPRDGQPRS